jgi:predicted solute-binding protein
MAVHTMRLVIHDTLATATWVFPLRGGWVSPAGGVEVVLREQILGKELGTEDVALAPAVEATAAQGTHAVGPEAAVVAGSVGAVAMRTPVRPDEVGPTPVRLWGASGTAEALARATLRPFYGIEPTGWPAEEGEAAARAQVVVVEGVEALRPPEAGFAEDLCRAWFILTGAPAVTHLLLVPLQAEREAVRPALATLAALRRAGHERRRELRQALAEEHGLPLDRLNAFFAEQRLELDAEARRAALLLLQRGTRGSAYPAPTGLVFLDREAGDEPR